jgi:hypothetical protein
MAYTYELKQLIRRVEKTRPQRLVPKQARLESSIIVGSGASRIITDKKNYS